MNIARVASISQMTNVKMSPVLRGHAAHKERPSPEGAGSSAYDSHAAHWTGCAGSLPTPLTHTLLRSKWPKESLNGYPPEYNSIKCTGTKRETFFDTGHLCKKCISFFNIFKGEAFKQVIDGNLSTKVSIFLISSSCIHLKKEYAMHFFAFRVEDQMPLCWVVSPVDCLHVCPPHQPEYVSYFNYI